ncbi:major facilitator superfamily domain-containing protein [Pyrenochaeta sp. MPI-SDFR-AT-0127]|nr:major facilitator superfamily domain-containing protein [Pyrenochaeta sp. MPI-SDFR-AT-0127]
MAGMNTNAEVFGAIAIEEKALLISAQGEEEEATWKTLPHKTQLLLLALCRLSAPLSNACLVPYLYFLIKSILSDPTHPTAPQQISRLTGLLVAAYPIGQMLTSILCGQLSDRYGRKPVILFGLTISVVANSAFGFSRTIGMLVFWRVLAGMANGMLGVMRTMTAEIVRDPKHQTRAFLAPPLIFNSGRVIALVIGGCLADPVDNLPSLFGPHGFFNFARNPLGVRWALQYPYALPALFNGAVLAACLVSATLWLRESVPKKVNGQDFGLALGKYVSNFIKRTVLRRHASGYTLVQTEEDNTTISFSSEPTHRPLFRDIWTSRLLKTLLAFALLPLHTSTFLHIFPVFLSMPTEPNPSPSIFQFAGGLGLASPTVGLYLAIFGIAGILLQLFIFPQFQKRLGKLGVFRLANLIFPLAYIFAPYLALLSGHDCAKWVVMAVVLFTQVMARTMAIPSSIILLTDAAPHRSVLGTVHGAGSTLSALFSACGPAIGGLLLAKGIEIGSVGLVWWSWLCTVSVVALGWSFMLDRGCEEKESCKSSIDL